ncbi:MAG: metallophosphoesterase [Deltaproteobacteria bacterium]|nr:metallophosphoesterase [Deltaproteobacteria bacterium]
MSDKRPAIGRKLRRAIAGLALLCAVDAVVEPHLLVVSHHARSAPTKRVRVAHLSDLHTGGFGLRERKLVARVAEERPDLIAITGDTVDEGDLEVARPVLTALAALKPPLGVVAVHGNWEHWRPVRGDARAFYASTGVRFLDNESVKVRDDLWIVGLDDPFAGHADVATAFARVPANVATIALMHAPIGHPAIDGRATIALAGHTHGGQVRVPWFGPLWRPPGSGDYDRGWYEGKTPLHVSSGSGTSVLRVRFACLPEIAILDLGG